MKIERVILRPRRRDDRGEPGGRRRVDGVEQRGHMAHQHPWVVRDAAMIEIGKVLTAAREAQENR